MFKVYNKDNRTMPDVIVNFVVFIVNFEHISHLGLVIYNLLKKKKKLLR